MQVSKEFLIEAVGLSLLVAFLMLGFQMFQRAGSLIQKFDREQEQQMAELSEYEITQYDGREMDGISVISYIKNMVSNYSLPVWVVTDRGEFTIQDTEELKLLREQDSEYYIGSWELYSCEVVRNENKSIEQIKIRITEGEEE